MKRRERIKGAGVSIGWYGFMLRRELFSDLQSDIDIVAKEITYPNRVAHSQSLVRCITRKRITTR